VRERDSLGPRLLRGPSRMTGRGEGRKEDSQWGNGVWGFAGPRKTPHSPTLTRRKGVGLRAMPELARLAWSGRQTSLGPECVWPRAPLARHRLLQRKRRGRAGRRYNSLPHFRFGECGFFHLTSNCSEWSRRAAQTPTRQWHVPLIVSGVGSVTAPGPRDFRLVPTRSTCLAGVSTHRVGKCRGKRKY
jgi:hypothetical protein